jgi:uncharacterized membrane protein
MGTRMNKFHPVDFVAMVLACAVTLIGFMIGLALVINVIEKHNSSQTLGENATQILIAVMGGLIGVLGSYIGFNIYVKHEDSKKENERER